MDSFLNVFLQTYVACIFDPRRSYSYMADKINNNFSHIVNNNIFHLLHVMSEHQQVTFNVQAVIKMESWHRERISGHWPGYVNFTTVIFRGCT